MSMTSFGGVGPINILSLLSRFLNESNLAQISEVQACLIVPKSLLGRALDHFPASTNALTYAESRYSPEYVHYFPSTFATTSTIRDKLIKFRDLEQLPRETEVVFSVRGNTVAYRCDNVFYLKEKIIAFILD